MQIGGVRVVIIIIITIVVPDNTKYLRKDCCRCKLCPPVYDVSFFFLSLFFMTAEEAVRFRHEKCRIDLDL